MSEETKEVATPPTPNNTEVEQLKESIKKLEAKNYELIGKLQNQKKDTKVPEDYELGAYIPHSVRSKMKRSGSRTPSPKRDVLRSRPFKDKEEEENDDDDFDDFDDCDDGED